MSSFRVVLFTALIAAFSIHSASALEIEDGSSKNAAAALADPDDKIPVAHVADDGSMQHSNMQPVGNTGLSFGFTGNANSGNNNADAFTRAQQNQQ